jgi:hypothetical protein
MIQCDYYIQGLCIALYKNGNGIEGIDFGKCEYTEFDPKIKEKLVGLCKKKSLIEKNLVAKNAKKISLEEALA